MPTASTPKKRRFDSAQDLIAAGKFFGEVGQNRDSHSVFMVTRGYHPLVTYFYLCKAFLLPTS